MGSKRKLRHKTENYYSIRAITTDDKIITLNTENWPEQNVQGLTALTKEQVPNWKRLDIKKCTLIYDTAAHKFVSKKRSSLLIGRIGMESICAKTDENFMKNGKIPVNISVFFGENQR